MAYQANYQANYLRNGLQQAGHGAVFWVDIPYVPESEAEAQKEPTVLPTRALEQRPRSSGRPQPGGSEIKLRVLLVEDCIMIQASTQHYQ